MPDHVHHLFGLPTGLFCIGCFTTELGVREAEDLGAGLKQSVIILYFMNATAKSNSSQECRVFIGVKNYLRGWVSLYQGVTLIRVFTVTSSQWTMTLSYCKLGPKLFPCSLLIAMSMGCSNSPVDLLSLLINPYLS